MISYNTHKNEAVTLFGETASLKLFVKLLLPYRTIFTRSDFKMTLCYAKIDLTVESDTRFGGYLVALEFKSELMLIHCGRCEKSCLHPIFNHSGTFSVPLTLEALILPMTVSVSAVARYNKILFFSDLYSGHSCQVHVHLHGLCQDESGHRNPAPRVYIPKRAKCSVTASSSGKKTGEAK